LSTRPKIPYFPGLDGLRAVAVVFVILYHLEIAWLPGGFLGVEVFFVISGYLITTLLLGEFASSGRIDLKGFWLRRARRLLPALALFLSVVGLYVAAFRPEQLADLRMEVVAASGYFTNWFLIIREVSYSESFSTPSPLLHLWSLAIEEQYYVIWPFLVWGGLRWGGRGWFSLFMVVGIVGSVSLMWLLFDPYQDPLRLYYGSDTRASGLLIGALTALYWRPWEHSRERKAALWLQVVGMLGLAGVVGLAVGLSEFDTTLYQGGFLICDVMTILAIAALVDSRTVVARLLGVAPMRWIGKRSYGLYLWHWPIILYVGSETSLIEQGTTNLLLAIGFLVGVTELSYRVIEQPIRRHGLVSTIKVFQADRTIGHFFSLVPTIALTSVTLWAGFVLAPSPSADAGIRNARTAFFAIPEECLQEEQLEDLELVCDVIASDTVHAFTLIGDSVIHGATNALKAEKRLDIALLADTSRSFIFGVGMMQEMAAKGELPPVMVVHLGTNGPVRAPLFDKMMRVLDKQKLVLFINIRVRRRWEGIVNETLAEGVKRFPTAELLDWHAHSKGQDAWFRSDKTHLSKEGERVIAQLLLERLDEIERLEFEKEPERFESSEVFAEEKDD
jgi:peptidoglycan/LPS O-acetylase OafA/YrhL